MGHMCYKAAEGIGTKRFSTYRRSTALLCIAALLCAALIALPVATLPSLVAVIRPVSLVSGVEGDDARRPRPIAIPLPLQRGPPA